jgi:hypothetical protein
VEYKVLKEDPEVVQQLEELYTGFLHVCKRYLPPHKQQIVSQELTSK